MTMMYDFVPSRPSHKRDAARILKELQSFAAFDRWMDEQLDKLEMRWSRAAAPNSHRVWRSRGKSRPR
jgi:hypothetical protein